MKLLKYYQYIKENFEEEDLLDYFIFLKDLDLEYSVIETWIPEFKKYSNGDYYDNYSEQPGEDKLFIFDHEYSKGFNIAISGNLQKSDWKEFWTNFGSTINWLKNEGYESSYISDVDPDIITRYLEALLNNDRKESKYTRPSMIQHFSVNLPDENLTKLQNYFESGSLYSYDGKDIKDVNNNIKISVEFYFAGPEKRKLTAKEMSEMYEWEYEKTDGNNIWIKVDNVDIVDRLIKKGDWYDLLRNNDYDIDYGYYYHKPDYEMMGSYSTKVIADKLKLLLKSDIQNFKWGYESVLWEEFDELYPDDYNNCNEILGDIYYSESQYQQRLDIRKCWKKYLDEIFKDINEIEGEDGKWLIKVESEWFTIDSPIGYEGFGDVLDEYLANDFFSEFRPSYRDYPYIDNKIVESEWLPILNKIQKEV